MAKLLIKALISPNSFELPRIARCLISSSSNDNTLRPFSYPSNNSNTTIARLLPKATFLLNHSFYHEFGGLKNEFWGTYQVLNFFSTKGWNRKSKESVEDLPIEFDWRNTGLLPMVRDQGLIESCWAFAVASAIEAGLRIYRGLYVSVSRQELLDRCYNRGKGGGCLRLGFDYVMRNGISYAEDYPYEGILRYPYFGKKLGRRRIYINGYQQCKLDELGLRKVVLKQPPVVGLCAGIEYWDYKKGQIFSANVCHQYLENQRKVVLYRVNHFQLLTGWGCKNEDHWVLQNSWGANWGDKGFMLLKRNKGGWGQCGIRRDVWFPIIK